MNGIQFGNDFDNTSQEAKNALVNAARSVYEEDLKILLEKGVPIDSLGEDGENAITAAAESWRLKTCKTLLDAGISINLKNRRGETALHKACLKGSLEICRLLIESDESGTAMSAVNNEGETPLMCAVRETRLDICEYLLDLDPKVKKSKKYAKKLLSIAVNKYDASDNWKYSGPGKIVQLFLDHDFPFEGPKPVVDSFPEEEYIRIYGDRD